MSTIIKVPSNGITQAFADMRYLQLDCSNDPLTGDLTLNNTATALTMPGFTLGSIPFYGAGGLVSQDNVKFFWDNTNKRVGLGTATPYAALDIKQTTWDFVGGIHLRGSTNNSTYSIVQGADTNLYFGYATNASGANVSGDFGVMMILSSTGSLTVANNTLTKTLSVVSGATTSSAVHIGEVVGEGTYISSLSDNQFIIAGGVELVTGSWTARSTKASVINGVNGKLTFYTDDSLTDGNAFTPTDRMNISAAGIVNIGGGTTSNARLGQLLETHISANYGGISMNTWSASNTNATLLDFVKSGSDTIGTHVIVVDTETIGRIHFRGSDGTNFEDAASIYGVIDGTPANNDMPGALSFRTTPSGTTSPVEHMLIKADGTTLIGASSGANYSKFEADGTLQFNGTATVWEDLRVPVNSIKVPGSNNPAWVSYSAGQLLSFASQAVAINEEEVYFTIQIPHAYKEGSTIYPHVHWVSDVGTVDQDVRWGLEYEWVNIDGTFSGTTTIYINSNIDAQDRHLMDELPTISGAGKTISSMLVCRLFRNSSDIGDTSGDPALLLEFDVHYELDTVGSRLEATK